MIEPRVHLSGADAEAARAAIHAITTDALQEEAQPAAVSSTAIGLAMHGLYLDRAGLPVGDWVQEQLERGIEALGRGVLLRYWGGLPGIGWQLCHVLDPADADAVCSMIDENLGAWVDRERWELDYDLVRGLVGFGMYAVARGNHALALRVLDHLEATAETTEYGTCWFSRPEWFTGYRMAELYPQGTYDLGVAHGQAGVIGLLARYVAAGIAPTRSGPLLARSVEHLLAIAPQRPGARFPGHGRRADEPHEPARLAWCYGDAGTALTLFAAAHAAGRQDWRAEAHEVARQMARRPFESTGVVTAGICHGAAGVAHAFHRLYRATGDDELREATLWWLRKTLELRRPGEGIGGYFELANDHPLAVAGLHGATGIALVLLSAITDVEPDWDEYFMFGVEPGA